MLNFLEIYSVKAGIWAVHLPASSFLQDNLYRSYALIVCHPSFHEGKLQRGTISFFVIFIGFPVRGNDTDLLILLFQKCVSPV